jgi:pyruvate formate lyase activating enzyme
MREALLYDRLNGKVRCEVCQRRCVINEGRRGFCHTRLNEGGKLFSLTYGMVASISINPIEKKPVFHFYPGSKWLSLGSLGCNFLCPGCQNWEIAHSRLELADEPTEFLSPEKSVRLAKERGAWGFPGRLTNLPFGWNIPWRVQDWPRKTGYLPTTLPMAL